MFIAYTQPNTQSSSLVQLHPFKDLILSSQINNNTLNPKDLQFKIILQYLKGGFFSPNTKVPAQKQLSSDIKLPLFA